MRYEFSTTIADEPLFTEMCHSAGHHDVVVEYDQNVPLLVVISDTITVSEINDFIEMCQPGTPSVVGTLKLREIRAKSKDMESKGFLFKRPSNGLGVCHVRCANAEVVNYQSIYYEVINGNVPYPITFVTLEGRDFVIENTTDFDALISNMVGHLEYVRGTEVNLDNSRGEALMINDIKSAVADQDIDAINAIVDTRIDFDGNFVAPIRYTWTPETYVNSVFGRTGDVVAEVGDYAAFYTQPGDNISVFTNDAGYISDITNEFLNDLSDVVITTPSDNEVLSYDSGSGNWINQTSGSNVEMLGYGHIHNDPAATTNQYYYDPPAATLGHSITVTIPATEVYKVNVSAGVRIDDTGKKLMCNVWIDGVETTEYTHVFFEPHDDKNQFWVHAEMYITLTAGSRSIEFRYGPSDGNTCYLYDCTLSVERLLI